MRSGSHQSKMTSVTRGVLLLLASSILIAASVSAQSLSAATAKMNYNFKPAPGISFSCLNGWTSRGRNCFRVFTVSQTFYDAQITCNRYGGHLAHVDLFDTSYFLGSLAVNFSISSTTDVWLGLMSNDSVNLQWSDTQWTFPIKYRLSAQRRGSPNSNKYGNWAPGHPTTKTPTGKSAHCCRQSLALKGHYPWYMENCWKQMPFICQYKSCADNAHFRCNNFQCIDKSLQCDGKDDCGDGSDEILCTNIPSQSSGQRFTSTPVTPAFITFSSLNPYLASSTNLWIIETSITSTAYIWFTAVVTEDKYDLVDVFTGGSLVSNSLYITTVSGSPVVANLPIIYSSNNFIIVRFTADDAIQYSGFTAQWSTGIKCDIVKNSGFSWASDSAPISTTTGLTAAQCTANCLSSSTCLSATFTNGSTSTCYLHAAIQVPMPDPMSNYWVKTCPGQIGNPVLPALPSNTVFQASGSWQTFYPSFCGLSSYMHSARSWTITTASAVSIISIQVVSSDLSISDSIDIYNGEEAASALYSIISTNIGNYYTTSQSTARIVWNNKQAGANRGFSFRYVTGCNLAITSDYTEIRTPGYDGSAGKYPNLYTFKWTYNPVSVNVAYSLVFGSTVQLSTGTNITIDNGANSATTIPMPGDIFSGLTGTLTITMTVGAQKTTGLGFMATISLECPDLPSIPHLNVTTDAAGTMLAPPGYGTTNAIVYLSCAPGYYIQEQEFGQCPGYFGTVYNTSTTLWRLPSAKITCTKIGWSYYRLPTCKPVYCGPPPVLANGVVASVKSVFYANDSSSVATYLCKSGFIGVGGPLNSTCQSNGQWSQLTVQCISAGCSALTLSANLTITKTIDSAGNINTVDPTTQTVPLGTIVYFQCPVSMDVAGLTRLVCTDTIPTPGSPVAWNSFVPVCTTKVCAVTRLNTAFISTSNTPGGQYYVLAGNTVTYYCIGTYFFGTPGTQTLTVTCGADGQLVPPPKECSPPTGSGIPSTPTSSSECAGLTNPWTYTFPSSCSAAGALSTTPSFGPGVCYCMCKTGYNGFDCSYVLDQCNANDWPSRLLDGSNTYSTYCLNEGLCNSPVQPQLCNCSTALPGFRTSPSTPLSATNRCGTLVTDFCSPNPCINGNCTGFTNGYYCTCKPGWAGVTCNTPSGSVGSAGSAGSYAFCGISPCRNDTSLSCSNATVTSCSCTSPAWTGVGCQCSKSVCSPNPCLNGGLCSVNVNATNSTSNNATLFTCRCQPGYSGPLCQNLTACSNLQCNGTGSKCIGPLSPGASLAVCQCPPGWGGDSCNKTTNWNFDLSFSLVAVGVKALWPVLNDITVKKFSFAFWFQTSYTAITFTACSLTDVTGSVEYFRYDDSWFNADASLRGLSAMDGMWHLVVLVCDGSSSTLKASFYFDSIVSTDSNARASYLAACSSLIKAPQIYITIGNNLQGGGISLVTMWQVVFTSTQITTLYSAANNVPASFHASIICDWNWGFYAYINVVGITRVLNSTRGLPPAVPPASSCFTTTTTSSTYQGYNVTAKTGNGTATPSWLPPGLVAGFANASSLVCNRVPGSEVLSIGTYPIMYMVKDIYGRWQFNEFYQIINYGTGSTNSAGTGQSVSFSSGSKISSLSYIVTAALTSCSSGSALVAPAPLLYTCWELGLPNVDNIYLPLDTPSCAPIVSTSNSSTTNSSTTNNSTSSSNSSSGSSAAQSVTFSWTYISSVYTVSIANFFKVQILNSIQGTIPGGHKNLLQELGCPLCQCSVTATANSFNQLVISITIIGISDIVTIVSGGASVQLSIYEAIQYEVFVSGLFTDPILAPYSVQQPWAAFIDISTFTVISVATCIPPAVAITYTLGGLQFSTCVTCPPGTFYSSSQQTCVTCPVNTSQNLPGQTSCTPCAAGSITFTNGAIACTQLCNPGFYNDGTSCRSCPPNWYQPLAGQMFCLPCLGGNSTSFNATTCGPPNYCFATPCMNQGTCTNGGGSPGFTCQCPVGYTGQYCQTMIDHCTPPPCLNGATCTNSVTNYTCTCATGYTGTTCQTMINNCLSSPCLNAATCINALNSYSCQCGPGFSGPQCQTTVNGCDSNPCLNQATCTNVAGGLFTCKCAPGYTGITCSSAINYCAANPCLNSGTCTSVTATQSFTCACGPYFTDSICGTVIIGVCAVLNPCMNGASCQFIKGINVCTCAPGFTGTTCASAINYCGLVSVPCLNGGSCVNGALSYTCQCAAGFTGNACQSSTNACAASPCQNGGTCQNQGAAAYVCVCPSEASGVNCEIVIYIKITIYIFVKVQVFTWSSDLTISTSALYLDYSNRFTSQISNACGNGVGRKKFKRCRIRGWKQGSVYAQAEVDFDSPTDDTTSTSGFNNAVYSTISNYLTTSGNTLGIDSQNMQLSTLSSENDPCLTSSPCKQFCSSNAQNQTTCSCSSGYTLSSDGVSCQALSSSPIDANTLALIVGIVVGGVVVMAIAVVICMCIRNSNKARVPRGKKPSRPPLPYPDYYGNGSSWPWPPRDPYLFYNQRPSPWGNFYNRNYANY